MVSQNVKYDHLFDIIHPSLGPTVGLQRHPKALISIQDVGLALLYRIALLTWLGMGTLYRGDSHKDKLLYYSPITKRVCGRVNGSNAYCVDGTSSHPR